MIALTDDHRVAYGVEPIGRMLPIAPSTDHAHAARRVDPGSLSDSRADAPAETIHGLSKAEMFHRRGPWRSFGSVAFAPLEWVDWFDTRRLLEPIGTIPPAEAEAGFDAQAAVHASAV